MIGISQCIRTKKQPRVYKLASMVLLIISLTVMIAISGCSGGASAQRVYKETEITPAVNGDTVTIPVDIVNSKKNVHFALATSQGTTSFEAYYYKDAIQVRASFCVPCRGTSFTLSGDTLICDNCGTVFSAKDGTGISGVASCRSYPKANVPFTTANGNVVMKMSELTTAFANTLTPGLP